MRLGGWAAGVSKAVNQRRSWWQERGIFITAVLAQVTTPPALSGAKVEVLHLILVGIDVPPRGWGSSHNPRTHKEWVNPVACLVLDTTTGLGAYLGGNKMQLKGIISCNHIVPVLQTLPRYT